MSQKAIICITTKSNIYYNRITSITLITNFIKVIITFTTFIYS